MVNVYDVNTNVFELSITRINLVHGHSMVSTTGKLNNLPDTDVKLGFTVAVWA